MGLHEGENGNISPPNNQIFIVIIAIAVVIGFVIAPSIAYAQTSSGTVEGTPHLSTSAPNAQFSPGENGVLSISVMNNATYDDNNETHPQEAYDRAGEADAVWINVSDVREAPLTVETGEQQIGNIPDGNQSGPYPFNVVVDENATAGTYKINVTTRYTHAEQVYYEEVSDGVYQYNETTANRNETDTITVEIEPEPQFDVSPPEHDIPLGGEGTLAVEIENTGGENVTEATVSLTSSDSDFYFGSGTATSEAHVGSWNENETKALRFRAGTVDEAVQREYPIEASISYTDSDDVQQTLTHQLGIKPVERTRFAVQHSSHDIPRNGEGTLTVTVSQQAGKTIEDVSVTASTPESEVYLGSEGSRSATTFVGTWDSGSTKQFTFRVGTTDSAVERAYPIDLTFDYTDADDNDNSRNAFIDFVPEDRDRFDISVANHDVPQDGEGTLILEIGNTEPTAIEEVSVTATASDSAVYIGEEASQTSSTVIREWEGNERHNITFRVGTSESAVDRAYPIDVSLDYTDEANNDNSARTEVEFVPQQRKRFNVVELNSTVPLEGEGTVTATVKHMDGKDIEDVSVTATTSESEVYLGSEGSRSATAFVGDWESGSENEIRFRVGSTGSAVERAYPIELTFDYTDTDNNDNSRTKVIDFVPKDRDRFDISVANHDVPQDGEGTLILEIGHTEPTAIEDVSITATAGDSAVYIGEEASQTSSTVIREWEGNEHHNITFRVGTSESAVDRAYPIDVTLDYTDEANNDNSYSRQVEFTPNPRRQFDASILGHDIPENGEGTMEVALSHLLDENISDVSVTATATDSTVYFGGDASQSSTTVLEEWTNTSEHSFTFRVGTTGDAVERRYPIELTIEYTDEAHNDNSRTKVLEFVPGDRTQFEVVQVTNDVPQNGEGTLEVLVRQVAGKPLEDITITASTPSTDVYLGTESSRSSSTRLIEWHDNRLRTLEFRVGTTDSSVDRDYPVNLEFEYSDADDSQNSRQKLIEFRPGDREQFDIESVKHTVPRDGEGTLRVEVDHEGSRDFEEVSVTASTTDSAVYLGSESSASSTTMVGQWDEHSTETLTYRVGTTESAVERTYPIELSIDYTDDDHNENQRTKYIEFTPRDVDHLEVASVSHTVPQDGVGLVTVNVSNTIDRNLTDVSATATTSDTEVYIGSDSSRSGTATIKTLPPEETRSLAFHVGTTANAVNRSYPLSVDFEYTDPENNLNSQTEATEFRPAPEPRFKVERVEHNVPIGGAGRVSITLRNDGPINATQATVTAGSETDALYFGTGGSEPVEVQGVTLDPPQAGTPTSQAFIGDWSIGETRTVEFRAGFDDQAISQQYVTDLTVNYENEAGDEMPAKSRSIGLEPRPEQVFNFARVQSELYVGEEGDLQIDVTNEGERVINGAVAVIETNQENVNFYNSRYSLGILDPDETATGRFHVGITEEAEHGPRVFELSIRYRDPDGNVRQTSTRDIAVNISPSRDAFSLTVQNTTFEPGESAHLRVDVRNERHETLSNIQAKMFTDDPLDSEDDTAFIRELAPGESTTISFDLSIGGGASPKTYSASMDFRFDNARGDSELSDTQRVPVEVSEPESNRWLWVGLFLGVVIIIGAVAMWRFGGVERLRVAYRERFGA